MLKLLTEIGRRFSTSAEKEIVKNIKEKACYVALNFENEKKNVDFFDYELPDGNNIVIKDQRIRCPEVLFNPSIIGKEGSGIAQMCYDSIQKCDIDLRADLYHNIHLTGGTSMFTGLTKRLLKEMVDLVPESMKFQLRINGEGFKMKDDKNDDNNNESNEQKFERKYAVWIGGKNLSNISSFQSNWITKEEYEEYGAIIVHRKCF